MAKDDVLALVSLFCLDLPVDAEVGRFYDEVVREIGAEECLVGTEEQAILPDEPRYTTQANTIRTLEFHTGQYGRLDVIDSQSLEACIWPQWRAGIGSATAVTYSHEDEDKFRLVPIPNTDDRLTIIRTEYREDVPIWLEIAIAFEVMSREFFRESDHQDIAFAGAAAGLAALLFQLLQMEFISAATIRPDTQVI